MFTQPKSMKLATPFPSSMEQQPPVRQISSCDLGSVCDVITKSVAPCPCCNKTTIEGRQTLNETVSRKNSRTRRSLFDVSLAETEHNNDRSDENDESDDEEDYDILPGVLDSGVEYRPRRIVAEGWVHKKGTGKDWLGSKAWKPRWARLVVSFASDRCCRQHMH